MFWTSYYINQNCHLQASRMAWHVYFCIDVHQYQGFRIPHISLHSSWTWYWQAVVTLRTIHSARFYFIQALDRIVPVIWQFHVTSQTAYYTFKVIIWLEANNRVPVIWWHVSYYIIFGWCNLRQSPSSYHSGWICIICVITSYVLNSCPSVMPTSQWQ